METPEAVRRAESLTDLIAAQAAGAEIDRRVSREVVDAVCEAELFELAVPTSLGGHGLGLDALAETTRTMARACPATAWTVSFLMLHAWLLSKLSSEGVEEVFDGTAAPLAAAPLAPTGSAAPADGGFVVNGRWEWATGSAHSDWLVAHAIEEGPELATRFVVMPMEDVTVEDVWFTAGMRATGSNTVVVQDCFVPAHRTIGSADLLDSTASVEGDGLTGIPVISALALVAAAPALGGAERAAQEYRNRLAERVLAYTLGDKAVEQPAAQMRLAAVEDIVATAGARWRHATRALTDGVPTMDDRVDARLAAASVVRMSREAISTACEGSGASVYFESHPLQRIQRDVETLKGHVIFDWDRTTELAGRHSLGLESRVTDMV